MSNIERCKVCLETIDDCLCQYQPYHYDDDMCLVCNTCQETIDDCSCRERHYNDDVDCEC
jgi:hypothetical protein